ncbi:MAG: hypothetical protein ACRCTR_05035 [Actinomycetota bacterium]
MRPHSRRSASAPVRRPISPNRFSSRLSRRLRADRDDTGLAMVTVLGIGTVLSALMLVSLTYAIQVSPQARKTQDWNAALAAAQAGVDDFVARLNQEDSYALSVDCTNNAWRGAKAAPACGYSATTTPGWQQVDGSNAAKGQFHYDVTPDPITGSVRLISTGKVKNSYRTLNVRVARGGSTDFLYYTDFESADPENTTSYPNGASPECGSLGPDQGRYWFQDRTTGAVITNLSNTSNRRQNCGEIAFAGFDVLDGRVHTNDTPGLIGSTSGGLGSQPSFLQGYETADPNCPTNATTNPARGACYRFNAYPGGSTTGAPYFGSSTGVKYAPKLDLADNSAEFVNHPGCQYFGDTRIRFNADGTMTVWNTASSGQTLLKPGTPSGTNCGNASQFTPTATTSKHPAAGQTVPVPTDLVIYVRNGATVATCQPGQIVNGTSSGSTAGDVIPQGSGPTTNDIRDITYFDPDSSTVTTRRTFTKTSSGTTWTSGSLTRSLTAPSDTHSTKMDCGQGNVYLEGTVNGRVTVAAENNIVVTNNLLLRSTTAGAAPSGTDIIGLVAANSLHIYHPVQRSRTNTVTRTSNNNSTTCNTTIGDAPTSAPSGVTSVTCTWNDVYSYGSRTSNSSYSNISYPGLTTSSGTRWIYGSLQTLQHSFFVQNYSRGADLGDLGIRGSIAQRYRGIVRSGSAGFAKDYSYDSRLRFQAPPYFPQWTNAVWGARTTGELKPAYVGQ